MVARRSFVMCLLLAAQCVALGQSSAPGPPTTVIVPSGSLQLRGLLWKPAQHGGPSPAVLFLHGSGIDAAHTSGLLMTDAAASLAPVFVRNGYVFLYLCRRGQGLSADQGAFIQDVLQREKSSKGDEARRHLQLLLLTTEQLDDALAGLSFLQKLASVDAKRLVVVGHSFGGQLALLAAERNDSVRAVVAFAPAANSWEAAPELRDRLLTAARNIAAPTMLVQAANDFSTAPGKSMDAERERSGKPHLLKIYPAAGRTHEDGHNFVYTEIPLWGPDVFRFLDAYVGH